MKLLVQCFQKSLTRTYLLWLSAVQMVLYLIVTILFILLDVLFTRCEEHCHVNDVETEILQFIHIIPTIMSVVLFIAVKRNDLGTIRGWLLTTIGLVILITCIVIGRVVAASSSSYIWFYFTPFMIEIILLVYVIVTVNEFYNIEKRTTDTTIKKPRDNIEEN